MKPALPWTIALAGLLLLAGAMAWATHSLVGMERTQHRMAAQAAGQERARLALWRMESLAAALVVEESARPPDQYRTTPDLAPLCSPVTRVRLHFELDADGRVRSPQTSSGPDKPAIPDEPALRLQELRARLAEKAAPHQWALLGNPAPARPLKDNRAWLTAANSIPAPPPSAPATRQESYAITRSTSLQESAAPAAAPYAPPQIPAALKPAAAQEEQEFNNKKEADMRQNIVGSLSKAAAQRGQGVVKPSAPDVGLAAAGSAPDISKNDPFTAPAAPFNVRAKDKEETSLALKPSAKPEKQLDALATAPAAAATASTNAPAGSTLADAASPQNSAAPNREAIVVPGPATRSLTPPADAPAGSADATTTSLPAAPSQPTALPALTNPDLPVSPAISDFRALWIKDALFLTRRISWNGTSLIQGAWVDWALLQKDLLTSVSDLFPAARLEPAPPGTAGGTDLLASLPVRFIPGALTISPPPFWSPLKLSLATAWGCVFLASAAVALVLRGMMTLSERRAAFVSAVTHELRTPLATFKLYSEMLADGLVKDPDKCQSYLETLTTEADRLGHLVENVLAYSRLERGKASDGQLYTSLHDLLQRVEPRLHQRTAQAGAAFSIDATSVPDDFSLTTDPAAVEQILFNLVDNACKYARRNNNPPNILLTLSNPPGRLRFAVCDHGPGLTRAEARKLFRPFHKSAREAAHTAPGVGLGLALCRRLGRDLGGSLEIDHTWPKGACFVLTLPGREPGPPARVSQKPISRGGELA